MNPGVTEEVSKTAQTVVEAMKSTPATLALVIFNVLFIFVVAYLAIKAGERSTKDAERWQEIAAAALKVCAPTDRRTDASP